MVVFGLVNVKYAVGRQFMRENIIVQEWNNEEWELNVGIFVLTVKMYLV